MTQVIMAMVITSVIFVALFNVVYLGLPNMIRMIEIAEKYWGF